MSQHSGVESLEKSPEKMNSGSNCASFSVPRAVTTVEYFEVKRTNDGRPILAKVSRTHFIR